MWLSISKKDSWGKKIISEGQLKEELVCENAWVWLLKIQRISEVRNEKELTANWESDSQVFNVPDVMTVYSYSWCFCYEWQQLVCNGGKEGIFCQSGGESVFEMNICLAQMLNTYRNTLLHVLYRFHYADIASSATSIQLPYH